MSIFGGKDKQGNLSVNFAAVSGLPSYEPGDAINATIEADREMLVIRTRAPRLLKRTEISLPLSKIIKVKIERETEIKEKNKSVIGRAAVGSVLGPVGIVVGAVSGVGKKEKRHIRAFVIIGYMSHDGEKEMVFEIVGATTGTSEFVKALTLVAGEATPDKITL